MTKGKERHYIKDFIWLLDGDLTVCIVKVHAHRQNVNGLRPSFFDPNLGASFSLLKMKLWSTTTRTKWVTRWLKQSRNPFAFYLVFLGLKIPIHLGLSNALLMELWEYKSV